MKEFFTSPLFSLILFFVVAIIFVLFTQPQRLRNWLVFAVLDAEKLFGSKTGEAKLRYVYSLFVNKFKFLSSIITYNRFKKMVDIALEKMNYILENNKSILDLVKGKPLQINTISTEATRGIPMEKTSKEPDENN